MIVNHERNRPPSAAAPTSCRACARELAASARPRADAAPSSRSRLGVTEADVGGDRGGGQARLSQRRLQDLRRIEAGAAEGDRAPQDRRHRRAPLRHGRALRLHLDRDGGLCRQHPCHLRHRAIRSAPRKSRAGGCRGSTSRGGETPIWPGRQHRLHHALRFGDEMWASCWHGGFNIVDVSDLAKPKTAGTYNYHPLFPEPTHTVMPVPAALGGRRIALSIDEEDQAQSASEEEARRGRAACLHPDLRRERSRRHQAARRSSR